VTGTNKIFHTTMSAIRSSFVGVKVNGAAVHRSRSTTRTQAVTQAREAPWLPGFESPSHLDGSLVGDNGFDPLGLGTDPETVAWYRQAELVHGRFAMWANMGILVPELASNAGISWPGAGVAWYDAGEFSYFTNTGTIFITQLFLMGWAENRRYLDIKNPGSVGSDPTPFSDAKLPEGQPVGYPGGIFNPFGWTDSVELKEKEMANGRLAMMAMLGYYVQHQVTGTTPLADWATHVASPWDTTILSNMSSLFVWQWNDPTFLANFDKFEIVTSLPPKGFLPM